MGGEGQCVAVLRHEIGIIQGMSYLPVSDIVDLLRIKDTRRLQIVELEEGPIDGVGYDGIGPLGYDLAAQGSRIEAVGIKGERYGGIGAGSQVTAGRSDSPAFLNQVPGHRGPGGHRGTRGFRAGN